MIERIPTAADRKHFTIASSICILYFILIHIVVVIRRISANKLSAYFWLVPLAYVVLLLNSVFNPLRLSSELLESDVVLRGCYEGTQNQATVRFRRDSTFEIHSTRIFFSNTWYLGTWSRHGDTLLLDYDGAESWFGDCVVIDNGYFRSISRDRDSVTDGPHFYLGYCKGAN
jgi:hypothetical protein